MLAKVMRFYCGGVTPTEWDAMPVSRRDVLVAYMDATVRR
jgi:hypothetical protein